MTEMSLPWRMPNSDRCPLAETLQKLGGKFKPQILHCLTSGEVHFLELQRLIGDISHKTLTQQLRDLEQDGLILRAQKQDARKRVGYSLSPSAQTLVPILQELFHWAVAHQNARPPEPASTSAVNT